MKKNLWFWLTLLVIMTLVAACGGAANPPAEEPAAEAPAATEEAAAEAPAATEEAAAEAPAATEEPAAEAPAATEEAAAEAPAAEGCSDAIGCVEIAAGDPIHIAWIATVSGATAPLGTDNNRGVEIAIADKGGELLGHPLELTGEDSLCSAEGGQTAGTKVASDPTIVGVIGTTCSSEARAAMPLLAEAGMVMISPSNTNPDLTNPEHADHHPGYLRTAHNDLFQGRIAAEFAFNELGVKSAATIHDGSPYAESLQQVFADVFSELGGTITSQEAVNVGDTDMKGVLTSIGADKPELIYFPIFEPEGDFIAAQKCDVPDLAETVMMGADGLTIDTFPEAAGECAIGMYLSGPFVQGQSYDDFVAQYKEAYGEAPVSGFHAHGYDATNMLFAAIEQVAVENADGSLSIGRQALRDALYGTQEFAGLTGKLSCDETGDCATGEALAIFQLTEAEVVEGAWPPQPFWQPGGGAAPAAEGEAMTAPPEGSFLARALAGEFSGTSVSMMGPFTDEDAVKFDNAIADFEEKTGIDIQYEGTKEFEATIGVRVDAGDAPDIVDFPQPGLLASFVQDGKVVDVNEFISEDWLKQQYNQSWLDMAQMEGPDGPITAGVWHRFNGKSLVWYPKDDFEAAGYEIPQTWDELVELTQLITDDGDTPWCIGIESGAATGWPATDWMEEIMLRTTSLENYDKWVTGELPFSSPEVKNAAEVMSEIWLNEDYVLGGRAGIVSTFFGDAPAPMFDDPPQCWLHKQGNFITSFFPADAEAGVNYDFFYLPPIDEAQGKPFLVAGDIMAMFNDRDEVRAVMEFFTTGESAKGWLGAGGALSPHLDTQLVWYGDDVERGVAALVQEATAFRFDGSDLMPGAVGAGSFWKGMTDYVSGTTDLDTALQEIDASWPQQ